MPEKTPEELREELYKSLTEQGVQPQYMTEVAMPGVIQDVDTKKEDR